MHSREEVNTLRTYEALYIIRPDISDDEIQTVAQKVETLVTDNEGSIVRSEVWGKRRLAYEVKTFTEGCYVLLRFQAPPQLIARLEASFRLNEQVIRNLIVHFDDHTLRLEEEQARRKEEEAERTISRSRSREDDDADSAPRSNPRDTLEVAASQTDTNE